MTLHEQNPDPAAEAVMQQHIANVLKYIGVDIADESVKDTPARVVRSWRELYAGYSQDAADILSRTFPADEYDEMIIVRDIDFHSTCEHHMLPFTGTAHVCYVPRDRVVGLSKIARLVDCYARRLQIQERLTAQIAAAIETHLDCRGVGVIIEAHHSCMSCRGVKKQRAKMITSDLRGLLREAAARAEFIGLSMQ